MQNSTPFHARHLAVLGGLMLAGSLLAAPLQAQGRGNPPMPVSLEGELEILVEDYPDQTHRVRHFLSTAQGRFELDFPGRPTELPAGTRVRASGWRDGELLALGGAEESGGLEVMAAALPDTLGDKKVALILVNFQDDTSQPISASSAASLVFTSVNNYFRENSSQRASISGQTYGWLTIPMSKSVCDSATLSSLADQAATAAGANLASFDRRLYLFPRNACLWNGLANVAGYGPRAYINGTFNTQIIAHELGHNYGVQHSRGWNCDQGPTQGTCQALEYGDVADTMGASRAGHLNPFQKERLGWLNDGVSPPIQTASSAGRYVVAPYSAANFSVKAVKIPRGTDPATGKPAWLYVEYRQPTGGDGVLAGVGNLTQGVLLRHAVEGVSTSSYLLDMTPNSRSGTTFDMEDGALAVGGSYTDPAGVTVSLAWADASGAAIDVSFGGSNPPPTTCTRAAPTVSLSGGGTSVAAGTQITYTVSVTNRDSSACSASSFSLARSVPSGWSSVLGASSLSISAGATASTTLSVTSASTATTGSYPVSATASGSGGNGSASATYSVGGSSVVLSNSASTDKASYSLGETAVLSTRVLNNGQPVVGASVSFRVTKANGEVVTLAATSDSAGNAAASLVLNKRKDPTGSYALRADASYGGKSSSATGAFTVGAASGGGKGGKSGG